MQVNAVNQITQLLKLNEAQGKSGVSSNDNSQAFGAVLEDMIKNLGNQNASGTQGTDSTNSVNAADLLNSINATGSTNSVNSTDLTNGVNATSNVGVQTKASSGLDSLSLNSQKLAQMIQLMQASASQSVMSNFGSDDSSGDSSDSNSDGLSAIGSSNPMGGSDDITQLLQTVLQNQSASASNTQNPNNTSALIQQILANSNSN